MKIMIVGAVARDILVRHYVGLDPARATADVDIAIAVSSWTEVDRLTIQLEGPPKVPHRFTVRGTQVDIIPFGQIESTDRKITWSDHQEMDVFGFAEAYRDAVQVTLPGGVVVPVASLPAQSLLKLFAWRDRRRQHKRDAIDLRTILQAYHQGPYHEELYIDHIDVLGRHDMAPSRPAQSGSATRRAH